VRRPVPRSRHSRACLRANAAGRTDAFPHVELGPIFAALFAKPFEVETALRIKTGFSTTRRCIFLRGLTALT
jgi:hypothetical protein